MPLEDPELNRVIEDQAASAAERDESRLIYQALQQRRDQLSGVQQLPPEDTTLTEKILAEARTRSAQISASRALPSGRSATVARGIPVWLWVAWAIAIAAVIAGFRYLN